MKAKLVTEEEERKREAFRIQLLEDEANRIAAEEESLRVEALLKIEEAAAVQREIEIAAQLERASLAQERSRELSEAALMHSMEAESRLSWEYEREVDLSCDLCPECSVRVKHGKKPRRRKQRRPLSTAKIKLRSDSNYQPPHMIISRKSRVEIEQGIAVLANLWKGKVADQLSRQRYLQAVLEPQKADILQLLTQSVSSSCGTLDHEVSGDGMNVAPRRHIVLGRGEERKGSRSVDPEGTLVQALRCWQQWSTSSGIAAMIGESSIRDRVPRAAASAETSTPPPTVLSQEETDQLVSLGLRPVGSADAYRSSYLDISLCVESLKSCSFLKSFADLRRLQLNVNKLQTLEGLESLCSLEELSVKDNALCNLSAIGGIRSLRIISADDNSINTEGLAALAGLSSLHTLSVNTNKLHVLPLLAGCSGLQRLHLYHNGISCLPSSSLAALCSLLHLDLGRNKLEFVCGAALSQCPLLQTLVLSQNQLTAPPSPLYLPNLRDLWLSGNRLCDLKSWLPHTNSPLQPRERSPVSSTEHELKDEDESSGMQWPLFLPLLEKLHLSDNALCEVSAAAVCNMPLLVDLDLSFNGLSTTRSLHGLCFLPKLSVLHLHDNPVYCSSGVDVGASDLISWLVQRCPSLKMLSGNPVDRRDGSGPNPASAIGLATGAIGGEIPWTPSTTLLSTSVQNTVDVTKSRQDMLAEHRRTGRWVSPYPRCSMKSDHHPQLTPSPSIGEASVGFEPYVPHTSSASFSRTQQLVQTLLTISFDQNVLKAREKLENVRHKYPSNTPVAFSEIPPSKAVDEGGLYWETACVKQLESHTAALMSWSWSADCPSSDLPVVWMSSRTVTQVIEEDDVCDSAAPVELETAEEFLESSSSAHVELAAPVPAGVVRLQAVWRSRKVRSQLRRVMLAARYEDDELDELLGEGDFDLEEALGGYDEYLAPIALRGRWQTDPKPYSTSATTSASATTGKAPNDPVENLHGIRLVKALAGGWLEGEIEIENEGGEGGGGGNSEVSDQESCSAPSSCNGGPLVYGDHRRRRKSSVNLKEGQFEQPGSKHAFSDGPESRPSDYSRSPQDRPFAFSQSLSADYAETFVHSPSSARTELHPLDLSGRPNSVPDLLARHNGTRSSISISISAQEGPKQGASQSAGTHAHRPKHRTVSEVRRDPDELSEKIDLRTRNLKNLQTGGKGNQRLK
jgi:Leucine-rich repeat (LRR) protein